MLYFREYKCDISQFSNRGQLIDHYNQQVTDSLSVFANFRRKEGNVLFNDALNTFYLRLYRVRHMVKDHSDSERGKPLLPHELLFPINSNVFLYAPSHRQDSTYHGLCYTSRGTRAGTRNSSVGPPHEGSIRHA